MKEFLKPLTEKEIYQERVRKHKIFCLGSMIIFSADFILSIVSSWIFNLWSLLLIVDMGTFGLVIVAYVAYMQCNRILSGKE